MRRLPRRQVPIWCAQNSGSCSGAKPVCCTPVRYASKLAAAPLPIVPMRLGVAAAAPLPGWSNEKRPAGELRQVMTCWAPAAAMHCRPSSMP